ncbi:hypothetical protein BOTBODRAFT_144355 [Botryobasidium botryosum FD-172 SS1]|uniref:SAM domain-containing protein n=1 Tax=Botryobasidium botryosum (strain FD-172 SS1) TaxID=930990 RepID=A0A067MYS5_BOTB1|nr:hypothetical protein BOTBODRAFT_144355 [Botryobasidium botryosum FD-172 SS1]
MSFLTLDTSPPPPFNYEIPKCPEKRTPLVSAPPPPDVRPASQIWPNHEARSSWVGVYTEVRYTAEDLEGRPSFIDKNIAALGPVQQFLSNANIGEFASALEEKSWEELLSMGSKELHKAGVTGDDAERLLALLVGLRTRVGLPKLDVPTAGVSAYTTPPVLPPLPPSLSGVLSKNLSTSSEEQLNPARKKEDGKRAAGPPTKL